jgi:hypothetical protein
MGFMQAQAVEMSAFRVETTDGTELVPGDLVGTKPSKKALQEYCNGKLRPGKPEAVKGWFSRFSAPGYLDCTEWDGPFETEEKALLELAKLHDVCPVCFETCWDENNDGVDCAERNQAQASTD